MKKTLLIFFLTFCFASASFAHPPSNIKINYIPKENTLAINFIHQTSNKEQHYIREIKIRVNDEEEKIVDYTCQDETGDVTKKIPMKLKAGDTMNVEIYCNKGGVGKATFVVSEK